MIQEEKVQQVGRDLLPTNQMQRGQEGDLIAFCAAQGPECDRNLPMQSNTLHPPWCESWWVTASTCEVHDFILLHQQVHVGPHLLCLLGCDGGQLR